ncbi:S8 family serine peptidase [Streptomyces sp. N35]|uniref:S8 family peptidase n=1 Tax=Streptomyces sp. N35 TaxID=2795730 RepID=UPI0018F4939D|nr:S8 family serine peptidase [Streptomyces sp. N35]
MTAGAAPSAGAAGTPAVPRADKASTPHRVQLITGDMVEVTDGRITGIHPAKGREGIPVSVRSDGRHEYAVPLDAQRLISEGRLDKRLFDATALATKTSREAYKNGLKVIIGYKGAASAARTQVDEAGATKVRRTLKSLNAEAVTTPAEDLPQLWNALTDNGVSRSAASGVDKVWLDGTVKARLDVSVPQIGADKAWAAGYDGKGVKVAVLDTGVDETHQELVGQQIVEKNFSTSADAKDRQGHGTHVASTIAGKGVKYKGVAPGAQLIDGKVLNDSGSGSESDIIEAIEWAAGEGADIVNMSLGGEDSPGVDPLEEAVNTYTAQGVLFAIAAGNEGPGAKTVGSPGAAEGALTVAAVDKSDKLADFSSRGPLVGDAGIKPDVSAPGVDITAASAPGNSIAAEVGENPPGYMTISGTSMATPHVAGAAALLKQQHPQWKAAELKGVLTASTKDVGYTAFEQGSGRIQPDKALGQSVHATPVSLDLGTAAYPHEDDEPITKTLTYKNESEADVTLDLTASGKGPGGAAAPEGMFEVSPAQLTVPAGGTAEATVTADTKVAAPDGQYSGAVVATGGEQSVRSAFTVNREIASYPVELKHLGRDGQAAGYFQTYVTKLSENYDTVPEFAVDEKSDSTTLRLPPGTYTVQSMIIADRADLSKGIDWIVQPKLVVTDKGSTVTLDARTAKPVDITVPDSGATATQAFMSYGVKMGYRDNRFAWQLASYENFRSAHLGPEITDGTLTQVWDADFVSGDNTQYALVYGGAVNRLADGYTKHAKAGELARIDAGMGSLAPGKTASFSPIGTVRAGSSSLQGYPSGRLVPALSRQNLYVSTENGVTWTLFADQIGDPLPNGWLPTEVGYVRFGKTYEAGRTYPIDFNTGVHGPVFDKKESAGIIRSGDTLYAFLTMFSDGAGNEITPFVDIDPPKATTALYRNGEKIAENDGDLSFTSFPLPKEDSEYTLTTSQVRDPQYFSAGTRIDASWTFRSKAGDTAEAAASTVRFHPAVDLASTVKAHRPVLMPYEIQGAAAGGNLKSLKVEASYDGGEHWVTAPVVLGKAVVFAPAKGKGITLRSTVVDQQGTTSKLTVHNAFRGR